MPLSNQLGGPNQQLGAGSTAVVRSEPISLGTLDRDCFVIPVHSVDRFLPAGIPVGVYHNLLAFLFLVIYFLMKFYWFFFYMCDVFSVILLHY